MDLIQIYWQLQPISFNLLCFPIIFEFFPPGSESAYWMGIRIQKENECGSLRTGNMFHCFLRTWIQIPVYGSGIPSNTDPGHTERLKSFFDVLFVPVSQCYGIYFLFRVGVGVVEVGEMTGSQDYSVAAPPPPGSQHSPASTSSLSSTASLPYTGT